jgi:hypothetical protein
MIPKESEINEISHFFHVDKGDPRILNRAEMLFLGLILLDGGIERIKAYYYKTQYMEIINTVMEKLKSYKTVLFSIKKDKRL